MDDIKQMTNYFVALSKASSREDDGTSDVLKNCAQITPEDNMNDITIQHLSNFELTDGDAELLYEELKEHSSKPVLYEDFEKWMIKAHKNCLALGYTLLDAKEVVKVLDKIMIVILIAIVIIAWLLLTDIANTKVLVVIASPFLAATFVFGETCKMVFEGITFSFINHPFDVGDRCIIDGVELEVKRMGILSTTFKLADTRDEATYPNSNLASKSIINLKCEPVLNDNMELTLDCSWTKNMLDQLQTKIKEFFENDKGQNYEEAHAIVVKEIGDGIKMTIQYRHVRSTQSHEKKKKQRSELLLKIKEFMETPKGAGFEDK